MALFKTCALVVIFASICVSALSLRKEKSITPNTFIKSLLKDTNEDKAMNPCCSCGYPISVTLMANNQLKKPFFKYKTEIKHLQRELIAMLETAASQDRRFRFSADHFGSMGYAITGLNQLMANATAKTYWHLSSSQTGASLPMGISQYTPIQGEVIMFNYTSWA